MQLFVKMVLLVSINIAWVTRNFITSSAKQEKIMKIKNGFKNHKRFKFQCHLVSRLITAFFVKIHLSVVSLFTSKSCVPFCRFLGLILQRLEGTYWSRDFRWHGHIMLRRLDKYAKTRSIPVHFRSSIRQKFVQKNLSSIICSQVH